MKKPHLYFRAYLVALLMLAAVPAGAADVKELFAIDLADYPGKESGSDIHVMLALRRSPGQVIVIKKQLNGADMVDELL